MRIEIKHFKNYKSQIEFCSDILSGFDDKNILLLGDFTFINDILDTNQQNVELVEYDDSIDEKEKSSLETSNYLYALVEEDSIKELNKFKGKIKCTAYILHNDEDNKILNKINNENECKNYKNCGKCNEYIDNDRYEDTIVEEYLNAIDYVYDTKQNRKEILAELFDLGYRTGEIETKLNIGYGIIEEAEKEINDLE